jgi:hypothetical protein
MITTITVTMTTITATQNPQVDTKENGSDRFTTVTSNCDNKSEGIFIQWQEASTDMHTCSCIGFDTSANSRLLPH